MPGVEYTDAPELKKMARALIHQHHPHLHGVEIVYLFMSEPPKSRGRMMYGKVAKKGGMDAAVYWLKSEEVEEPEDYFIVCFAKPVWDKLKDDVREAAVDDLLCQCGYDEERDTLAVVGPDAAIFHENVKRFGLWQQHLRSLGELLEEKSKQLAKQQKLPMDATAKKRGTQASVST